jgi:class 3 adenylate cyclase
MDRTPAEGRPWTLARVHEVYPWPEGWFDSGPSKEVLWTFDLDLPRETLWPQISDTSAINRGLKLPRIDFSEIDGKLHASTGGLVGSEWVEQPWQWEFGRRMSYERIYRKGLPRYIRTLNVFEQPAPGVTRMITYTGMVARSWLGATLFGAYMKRLQGRYGALLQRMVALAKAGSSLGRQPSSAGVTDLGRQRANAIRDRLLQAGHDAAYVDTLLSHVLQSDELQLHRLRIRPVARQHGLDAERLLAVALAAANEALLLLRWDVVCPHCRGLRGEIDHLGDVPTRGTCDPCGIGFDTADAEVIEITFRVHPQIRDVPDRVYCAAEPATKQHIRLQRTVAPGERYTADTLLSHGHYRARIVGGVESGELDLGGAGEGELQWHVGQPLRLAHLSEQPSLELVNETPTPQTFVVEEHERDANAMRPADVFAVQAFRDYFSGEHLGVGVALDVGIQTILFTDVVGSTRFYLDAGDVAAFAEIRQQFVLAYPVIEKHDGVVVKTIGDAVMAAFRSPVDAVAAAIELQRVFDGEGPCSLRIRATLHTGSCLAVNLNTGVDYFGTTVNLAAKIQAVAGAGEVAWTQDVQDDPEVRALVQREGLRAESLDFTLADGAQTQTLHRVKVGASGRMSG